MLLYIAVSLTLLSQFVDFPVLTVKLHFSMLCQSNCNATINTDTAKLQYPTWPSLIQKYLKANAIWLSYISQQLSFSVIDFVHGRSGLVCNSMYTSVEELPD